MAQINFRIDDETKTEAEALFSRLGLTMSGAITVFLRQSINERGIPFRVRIPDAKPKEELLRRIDDVRNGRNCHFHDLVEPTPEKQRSTASRRTASRRRRVGA